MTDDNDAPDAVERPQYSPELGRQRDKETNALLQQVHGASESVAWNAIEKALHPPFASKSDTAPPVERQADSEDGRIYPCAHDGCDVMRSRSEGGKVFTVCDEHWTDMPDLRCNEAATGEGATHRMQGGQLQPIARAEPTASPVKPRETACPGCEGTGKQDGMYGHRTPSCADCGGTGRSAEPPTPQPDLEATARKLLRELRHCLWADDNKHSNEPGALRRIEAALRAERERAVR